MIGRHVRAGAALHADDTTVSVLAPGLGKTKPDGSGLSLRDERPWGSVVPPAAFYHYSANRMGIHAEALLGTCRGFLHADGYAGFEKALPTNPRPMASHRWSRLHAGAIIWSRFLCGVAGRGPGIGR